jgi:hypothetical protein
LLFLTRGSGNHLGDRKPSNAAGWCLPSDGFNVAQILLLSGILREKDFHLLQSRGSCFIGMALAGVVAPETPHESGCAERYLER